MSLPLVGKFLQVSLTVNVIEMLPPIMSYRSMLPLFHSVESPLALSNVIHPSTPTVRLYYGLVICHPVFSACLSLLTHVSYHISYQIVRLVFARDDSSGPTRRREGDSG